MYYTYKFLRVPTEKRYSGFQYSKISNRQPKEREKERERELPTSCITKENSLRVGIFPKERFLRSQTIGVPAIGIGIANRGMGTYIRIADLSVGNPSTDFASNNNIIGQFIEGKCSYLRL